MKKTFIWILICIMAIVGIFLAVHFSHHASTAKKTPSKIHVLVIGKNNPFVSTSKISIEHVSVQEAAKSTLENTRFLLLSNDEHVDVPLVTKWIKEKKVVLFYGNDLDPTLIEKNLGVTLDLNGSLIESTVDVPYIMFGYGYSLKNHTNVAWFLNGNDRNTRNEYILDFIQQHQKD